MKSVTITRHPDLDATKRAYCRAVDQAADDATKLSPARAAEYAIALAEAEDYLSGLCECDVPDSVQALADAHEITADEAAMRIRERDDDDARRRVAIRGIRLRAKGEIRRAATARAAYEAHARALGVLREYADPDGV